VYAYKKKADLTRSALLLPDYVNRSVEGGPSQARQAVNPSNA
jgi:hypothetical protein